MTVPGEIAPESVSPAAGPAPAAPGSRRRRLRPAGPRCALNPLSGWGNVGAAAPPGGGRPGRG